MLLGERLKQTREDLNLSLKKFSDVSKIQIKYLERLEGGQYAKLPAFVYVQGFLKKYAQILDLPFDELVADYQKESGISKNNEEQNSLRLPELKSPRFVVTPKKISWAIVGLVVILVGGYFVYELSFLLSPPKLAVNDPAGDITIEASSVQVSGQSDASARLTINGQQVFVDTNGRFSQLINLSPGVNTLKIEATNHFGKKSDITRQIIVK